MEWNLLKDEAARLLFDKDALHIYAALVIQVGAAKLSRRSLGDLFPWLMVLCVELVNEWFDMMRGREPRLMPWQVVSGVHDIINTMILPTVLLLLTRKAPGRFDWRGNPPRPRRGLIRALIIKKTATDCWVATARDPIFSLIRPI